MNKAAVLMLLLLVVALAGCVGVQEAGKPRLVLPHEVPLNETSVAHGCVVPPPAAPESSLS